MFREYWSADGLRAVLVLVSAILLVVTAYGPDLRRAKHTITSRAAPLENPVVPIGWAFAIWGLIFLSCQMFAVWQVLPGNLAHPFARQIGGLAIATFLACSLWQVIVPQWGYGWLSLLLIAVELIGLSGISVSLAWGHWAITSVQYWIVALPFLLLAGWASAAFFVNLSLVLRAKGVRIGSGLSILLLVLLGGTTAIATVLVKSWIYSAAVIWALLGIAAANRWRVRNDWVAVAAGGMAVAIAALSITTIAPTPTVPQAIARTSPSRFPEAKTVETPTLIASYYEYGPKDGPVIIALHGFPDDATAWHEVGQGLASKGYRVLAPDLRGFGRTRFKDAATPRSGQLAALVTDAIAFADALQLDTFSLMGHDWGSRAAQGVAALYPQRVERLVSFSGYALSYEVGEPPPLSFLPRLWYQFALNMPMGEGILATDSMGFAYELWRRWSPDWEEGERDRQFAQAAVGLQNPDFAAIALSGYSYSGKGFDPALQTIEDRLADAPTISVPTIIFEGEQDGLEVVGRTKALDAEMFTQSLEHRSVSNAGHWPHRETPEAVIALFP